MKCTNGFGFFLTTSVILCCIVKITEVSGVNILSKSTAKVRHFMDPKSCSQFYRCGSVRHVQCQHGQLFSFELQKCADIALSSADVDTESEAMRKASKNQIRKFPDVRHKYRYYECLDQPVNFRCPKTTVFNERTEICDWKKNVPRCS